LATLTVEREERRFFVEDDPQSGSWGFWEKYAQGAWEPELLARMDGLLFDGGLYLDIGAWIGPTVLWASRRADQIVAAEPDPVAFDVLASNVALNGLIGKTRLWKVAIGDQDGEATLYARDGWGSSMSSLLTGNGGAQTTVDTIRLENLPLDQPPALVKIDIEGGEAIVLPDAYPLLAEWGCPILLSLHWPWIDQQQATDLQMVLSKARSMEPVGPMAGFCTMLVTF